MFRHLLDGNGWNYSACSATMAAVIIVIGPIIVNLSILPEVFCKGLTVGPVGLTKESISKEAFSTDIYYG